MSASDAWREQRREQWPDWAWVNKKVSHGAILMTVGDEGMETTIAKSDQVLYDPALVPKPNNLVVAHVQGDEEAIVRRYRVRSFAEAKRDFELVPENPNFPIISSRAAHIKILGTAVQHLKDLL